MTRLLSIDVFRGLTVALMIFVNCIDSHVAYPWVIHSAWNGCTLADIVFPFFVLIVGVSAVLSIHVQTQKGFSKQQISRQIVKRTVMLFGIGLLLNIFPNNFELGTLRIMGVLQRIALCYFFASIICLITNIRIQAALIVSILLSYWGFMQNFSEGSLTQDVNFAGIIDKYMLGSAHPLRAMES